MQNQDSGLCVGYLITVSKCENVYVQWIGQDGGRSHGVFQGTDLELYWKDWREVQLNLVGYLFPG
jgi:hypothetical protein